MEIPGYKKYILPLLSFISFLSIVLNVTPLYSQDIPPPSRPTKNIKGFFEIGLSTQIGVRTVVEETSPGEIAEGDAESTRVMARFATRPFRPVEIYLQAGMANLKIDYFNDFFIDYSGDYSLAYGGGVAFTVYEALRPRRFNIIIRGDTLNFVTEDRVLVSVCSKEAEEPCPPNPPVDDLVDEEIRWREYTIESFGIWRTQYWEPYLGVRFSWLDSTDRFNGPVLGRKRVSLEEDDNLGFVIGTNLYFDPRENFALNFELTLIDKDSLGIGLKLWY